MYYMLYHTKKVFETFYWVTFRHSLRGNYRCFTRTLIYLANKLKFVQMSRTCLSVKWSLKTSW